MDTQACKILQKHDIIGHRIRQILRSEWYEDKDGYAGSAVFVELDSGLIFELIGIEYGTYQPITTTERSSCRLFLVNDFDPKLFQDSSIVDVVTSQYWPTIGLLLSNDNLLIAADDFTPRRVGPCLTMVGMIYQASEFEPYFRN